MLRPLLEFDRSRDKTLHVVKLRPARKKISLARPPPSAISFRRQMLFHLAEAVLSGRDAIVTEAKTIVK